MIVCRRSRAVPILAAALLVGAYREPVAADLAGNVSASASVAQTSPAGAVDGDRFSTADQSLWKGAARQCSWQIEFKEPQSIGAILQINGDDPHVLQNAPRNYSWQVSDDGQHWRNLKETVVHCERRMYRVHRLRAPVVAKHLRIAIHLSHGQAATLREVEVYGEVDAEIPFDDWIIGVSSLEEPESVRVPMAFVNLARECEGWEHVPAQCLWHGDFDMEFVSAEPRPLCAFFSGSLLEWCQCSREPWRGVQDVLKSRRLPMWGACGGAQIFAILEETGVDQPWDCPRCRDPENPLLPVYSHIGHTGVVPCGDYSQNIGERGLFKVQVVADDPVLKGLPRIFEIYESHIGQIDYVPQGWTRVVTKGPGGHTVNQVLRTVEAPIYSAQFHCETYAQTKEASVRIMRNFLRIAKEWGGFNPDAAPLEPPDPLPEATAAAEGQ